MSDTIVIFHSGVSLSPMTQLIVNIRPMTTLQVMSFRCVILWTWCCVCSHLLSYGSGGLRIVTHASITQFTLALLIRSETGFAPMRAFTLHQLIRINDLIRIKLNHLLEVVSHRFSLLRVLIASVDATGTKIKAEQI